MLQEKFVPPAGAFTRSVTIRFSHCDPAGIVYFPHYFDMFNGVIEDWYTYELGCNYAELITGSRFGFPFVHLDCDFKIPSRMGDIIDMTLLVEKIGRSSLGIAAGIAWAIDQKADVISMSLGSSQPSPTILSAIERIPPHVILVCAAGNSGPGEAWDYPGAWPRAISVASINQSRRISQFSSRNTEEIGRAHV